MVGVFVAFIRVVYGRMIYMSLPIVSRSTDMNYVTAGLVAPERTIGSTMYRKTNPTTQAYLENKRNKIYKPSKIFH